jgi:hypothetical protein
LIFFDVYAPLSIAAVVSVSLVGFELGHGALGAVTELDLDRSSDSSRTATGIVRLAIELGGRHQIGH